MLEKNILPHGYSDFVKITATNGYSLILKSFSMTKSSLTPIAQQQGIDMVMWEWMWHTGNIKSIVRLLDDQITSDGYLIIKNGN